MAGLPTTCYISSLCAGMQALMDYAPTMGATAAAFVAAFVALDPVLTAVCPKVCHASFHPDCY